MSCNSICATTFSINGFCGAEALAPTCQTLYSEPFAFLRSGHEGQRCSGALQRRDHERWADEPLNYFPGFSTTFVQPFSRRSKLAYALGALASGSSCETIDDGLTLSCSISRLSARL